MIANQAAQQVANLLLQAGVPSAHAMDVAQRLLSMAQSSPPPDPGVRSFNPTSANTVEFFNQYKQDEERAKDGAAGKAGKDGLPGYGGRGVDGRDGMPGVPGQPGMIDWETIRNLIAAMIQEALAAFLVHLLTNVLTCRWFRQKFRDCMDSWPRVSWVSPCPTCCKKHGRIPAGTDVCRQLSIHEARTTNHARRIAKIEKELKNTISCEDGP